MLALLRMKIGVTVSLRVRLRMKIGVTVSLGLELVEALSAPHQ